MLRLLERSQCPIIIQYRRTSLWRTVPKTLQQRQYKESHSQSSCLNLPSATITGVATTPGFWLLTLYPHSELQVWSQVSSQCRVFHWESWGFYRGLNEEVSVIWTFPRFLFNRRKDQKKKKACTLETQLPKVRGQITVHQMPLKQWDDSVAYVWFPVMTEQAIAWMTNWLP